MTLRIRDQLYAYQKRIVEFIKANPNCAIWADMGLGKTAATLTALRDMHDAFTMRRTLVVAPLRVARKVWTDEAQEWEHLKDIGFAKIIGSRPTRRTALIQPGEIHLINRENLRWLVDTYFEPGAKKPKQKRFWPYDTMVLDESQSFMSQSSDRWQAARQVRKLTERVIELTGTPTPRRYPALWAQMFLLDRGMRLGQTETAFYHRWFDTIRGDGYSQYKIKEHAAKEIQEKVADIVLSLKVEDYFELPPVKYNPVRVQLKMADRAIYNKLERKYIADLMSGNKVIAANAAVCSGKLLQLANGFLYTGEGEGAYEVFHNEKILALQETLENSTGPVMIAHQFVADRERIIAMLKKFVKPGQRWLVADSDADLEAFAKGLVDYLVIHPASAGHGLNDMHLSGSETIVWFGLTANLEWFQQLNARLIGGIRRLGKNVIIHMILCDQTIDQRWMELLTDKAAEQEDLTKALSERARLVLKQ